MDGREMKSVTRLREPAIAMLILQALLATPGFPEFMYNHPASIVGVAASTLLALAWIALAAWSGTRGWRSFLTLMLVFWGAAIIVCLLTMWAAGSDSIVPGHQALLLVILVLGPALHGLSPYVPIESQQVRYLVTAIGILTLSLVSFVLAWGIARRQTRKPLVPTTAR
jgi:hypothetical protein